MKRAVPAKPVELSFATRNSRSEGARSQSFPSANHVVRRQPRVAARRSLSARGTVGR